MPRKKVEKPEPHNPSFPNEGVAPEYIDSEHQVRLPRDVYWRWRALDSEIQKHILEHRDAKRTFEDIVAATPGLVDARARMAAAKSALQTSRDEYEELKNEVQAATKFDITKCVIDDRTGRITVIEVPPAPTPTEAAA